MSFGPLLLSIASWCSTVQKRPGRPQCSAFIVMTYRADRIFAAPTVNQTTSLPKVPSARGCGCLSSPQLAVRRAASDVARHAFPTGNREAAVYDLRD